MTIYQPTLTDGRHPRYLKLAAAIERDVSEGRLAPGERLPPQRELAWRLGVTVGTVGRAYAEALRRGLLVAHVGRGTFVARPGDAHPADPAVPIDLARNAPPPGLAPALLAESLAALAAAPGAGRLLDYAPEAGHPRHREAGSRWIARSGLAVAADQVMVTGGVQQSLGLLLAGGLAGDRPILVEALTYFGALDAAATLRAAVAPVSIDAEGMRPEALDAAALRTGARLVLLVPTRHNPTTATMSAARRASIAEVARRRDLIVVEDDAYGVLPAERPAPIAALAPERTVYLSGIAKCLAPGLRAGWLAAPPPLLRRLADTQRALHVTLPPLNAEIAAEWVSGPAADRQLAWQRRECAERHALAAGRLAGLSWRTAPDSLHLLLDMPTPWRAEAFVAAARARGVLVLPARQFAAGGGDAPEAVRVALGNPADRDRLAAGLDVLAELARMPATVGSAII